MTTQAAFAFGSGLHPAVSATGIEPAAKSWGTNRPLYRDREVELVCAEIRRGGYSSRHQHRGKANSFLVLRGRLLLTWYAGRQPRRAVLTPSTGLETIPAGVEHRFLALDDTLLYEFYHAAADRPLEPDDIHRCDEGGMFSGAWEEFPI